MMNKYQEIMMKHGEKWEFGDGFSDFQNFIKNLGI